MYLRLYKKYSVPGITNKKLDQQKVGPLEIQNRIERLTYRLKLPSHFFIHFVISVAYLESTPKGPDLYNRLKSDHPPAVFVEGDTDKWKSYNIKKLIKKRVHRYNQNKPIIKYLVY